MGSTEKVRWRKHYNNSQKMLLVGEGDFSFSASLARTFRSATNMVATSLLTEDELLEKHWSCGKHLDQLYDRGCELLYGVNVYNMKRHRTLKHMKFDVIVFNFPHAGHVPGLSETDEELIEMHQELLGGLFWNARKMLTNGGQVHVTQREGYAYNQWKIVELGEEEGLFLRNKVPFLTKHHPGYQSKRGGDIHGNKTFPVEPAATFMFSLTPAPVPFHLDEDLVKIESGVTDLMLE